MAKKQWKNAEVIWDNDSDPDNAGWIVSVDEVDGDSTTHINYAPHPDYYHADADADTDEILQATARWEGAGVEGKL